MIRGKAGLDWRIRAESLIQKVDDGPRPTRFAPASCCSPRLAFISALPFCHFEVRVAKPKSEAYPKQQNSLGEHIRARRIDRGLLQSQVAELIGVHKLTVTKWEGNESQPAVKYIPPIVRFLGYNPTEGGPSIADRLLVARRSQGLTQRQTASQMGIQLVSVERAILRGPMPDSIAREAGTDATIRARLCYSAPL